MNVKPYFIGVHFYILKMRLLVVENLEFFYIAMLIDITGNLKAFLELSRNTVNTVEIYIVNEGQCVVMSKSFIGPFDFRAQEVVFKSIVTFQ